jgi:hypothetical protein
MLEIDPHAERVLHLVRQWVVKAENDLQNATHTLHLQPELSAEEQARLNDYAVAVRYPDDYEPVALAEAERAVQVARRVRTQVRRRLPKAGTTPPTKAA